LWSSAVSPDSPPDTTCAARASTSPSSTPRAQRAEMAAHLGLPSSVPSGRLFLTPRPPHASPSRQGVPRRPACGGVSRRLREAIRAPRRTTPPRPPRRSVPARGDRLGYLARPRSDQRDRHGGAPSSPPSPAVETSADANSTRSRTAARRSHNHRRVEAKMNGTLAALNRRLDRESATSPSSGLPYPPHWDPFFHDWMTRADLYRRLTQHYDFHRAPPHRPGPLPRTPTMDPHTTHSLDHPPPPTATPPHHHQHPPRIEPTTLEASPRGLRSPRPVAAQLRRRKSVPGSESTYTSDARPRQGRRSPPAEETVTVRVRRRRWSFARLGSGPRRACGGLRCRS
jgi:hypothetical protein